MPEHQEDPQQRPSIGLSVQDAWADYFQQQGSAAPQEAEAETQAAPDSESPEGGLIRTTGRGLARGVNELSNLAVSGLRSAAHYSEMYKLWGDDEFQKDWVEWYERDVAEVNPLQLDIADARPEGMWGVYEAMVQFGSGFVAGGFALKGLGLAARLGPVAKGAAQGAVADFAFFDAQEQRLSDAIQAGPSWLSNPIAEFLASNPGDSEIEGRLKNTLEGALLGGAVDSALLGFKALRAARAAREGRMPADAAAEAIEDASSEARALADVPTEGPYRVLREETEEGERWVMQANEGYSAKGPLKGAGATFRGAPAVRFPDGSVYPAKGGLPGEGTHLSATVNGIMEREGVTAERALELIDELDELPERGVFGDDKKFESLVPGRRELPDGAPARREFATEAEAQRAAASFRLVSDMLEPPTIRESPSGPLVELGPAQLQQVRNVTDRILTGTDPNDAEALLEGIDFNFGRITTQDETRALLNSLSEVIDADFASRTNRASEGLGQSHAQTIRMAEDMIPGMNGADMIERLIDVRGTTHGLPQTILAARMMMYGQTRRVTRLGRAVDIDPRNTIAVRSLADEMDNLANLAVELAGAKADVARSLNAMAIDVSDEALDAARKAGGEAAEELPAAAGARRPVSGALRRRSFTAREIAALARGLTMTADDPNAVLRMLRLTMDASRMSTKRNPSTFDKLVSFRASMMLYGPKTHFTNFISSALTAATYSAETVVGGVLAKNPQMTRQGLDELIGPFADGAFILRSAARNARKAWGANRSILDPNFIKDENGISVLQHDLPNNFFTKFLAAPGRALITADEFVKRATYMSSVRAQSLRMIRQEMDDLGVTMTRDDVLRRVYDDLATSVDEGGEALWYNSLQRAREATFTQRPPPGSWGHGLAEFANKLPLMRLIMPFVRTPINIMDFSLQRLPAAGLIHREMREMMAAGGEQRAMAIARQASGTFAYSMAALLAYQGLITGRGSDNPNIRKQMLDSGWQPYSVKLPGGKWVSFRRLEPLATPLGIMADFVGSMGEMDNKTREEHAISLTAAFTSSASSKTFLIGLTDFFEAVGSGEAGKMDKFLSGFAGSFAPAFGRQLDTDPVWREANSILESTLRNLPGISRTLEPRRNLLGEPVYRPARQAFGDGTAGVAFGYLNHAFNPFTVIDSKGIDDIQEELVGLGRSIGMPRDKIANGAIRLRDRKRWRNRHSDREGQSPYDRWMELISEPKSGGSNLRSDLIALMRTNPDWRNLPATSESSMGSQRWVLANRLIQQHQDRAWEEMLDEYPDLARAINFQRVSEIEARFGVGGSNE